MIRLDQQNEIRWIAEIAADQVEIRFLQLKTGACVAAIKADNGKFAASENIRRRLLESGDFPAVQDELPAETVLTGDTLISLNPNGKPRSGDHPSQQ